MFDISEITADEQYAAKENIMTTITFKDSTTIEREVRTGWFTSFVHALQVAVIMKASQAKNHAELTADWNNAWRKVEG